MSLSGNLEDMSLQDILQIIHHSKKSGTLHLEGTRGEGSISFHDGVIVDAHDESIPDVEPAQAPEAVRSHITTVVGALLTWTDGTFALALHDVPASNAGIDTQHLLLAKLRGPSEAAASRDPDAASPHPSRDEIRSLLAEIEELAEPTEITLSLLRMLTPYFDRAILFAVAGESLAPLGAFGRGRGQTPISALVQELTLPIEVGTPFSRTLRSGRIFLTSEAALPAALMMRIGRARSGHAALLPLMKPSTPSRSSTWTRARRRSGSRR
ncbi:MAG: DUF4388 domain-containing protein [Acidobacteriota bacterium]